MSEFKTMANKLGDALLAAVHSAVDKGQSEVQVTRTSLLAMRNMMLESTGVSKANLDACEYRGDVGGYGGALVFRGYGEGFEIVMMTNMVGMPTLVSAEWTEWALDLSKHSEEILLTNGVTVGSAHAMLFMEFMDICRNKTLEDCKAYLEGEVGGMVDGTIH